MTCQGDPTLPHSRGPKPPGSVDLRLLGSVYLLTRRPGILPQSRRTSQALPRVFPVVAEGSRSTLLSESEVPVTRDVGPDTTAVEK